MGFIGLDLELACARCGAARDVVPEGELARRRRVLETDRAVWFEADRYCACGGRVVVARVRLMEPTVEEARVAELELVDVRPYLVGWYLRRLECTG